MQESVLIVGVGQGLSASLARLCFSKGMKVVLAARNVEKLEDLKKEVNAETYKCDSSDIESVKNSARALFYFSLGLPAFSLIKIFSSFLFARNDTNTPFKISLLSIFAFRLFIFNINRHYPLS